MSGEKARLSSTAGGVARCPLKRSAQNDRRSCPGRQVSSIVQQRRIAASPTSGNAGKWPEVTSHFLPLSVSGSVQGHFMNLDYWKKLRDKKR